MDKERRDLRTISESYCQLIGLDREIHYALLGNISAGGALVKMIDNASHDFHIGEMCGLIFRDNLNMNPERLTGKIVRLECGSVGITFHNQEHIHLKKKFIPPS
jgi:hypothetical protein